MRNYKLGILAVVAILGLALVGSPSAFANVYPSVGDTIVISPGLGGNLGGGEFNVNVLGVGSTLDFISFCLETNEHLSYGTPVLVGGISDAAILGGSGGSVGGQDPLDQRTAFLYTGFINHTLAGFDFNSATDANDLQSAIWFIEQELPPYGVTNKWVDLADAAVESGAWSGLGQVRVANLINPRTQENAQDILTLVPEPSMMLLFGAGLLGLGMFGRRKNG